MLSDKEKKAINLLKSYENKLVYEISEKDKKAVKTILNLIEKQSKENESWKKYCDEQENDITLKNNKICDLEFKIEKQSKEIEELKEQCKEVVCIPEGTCFMLEPKDVDKKWENKIKEILGIEEDIDNEKLLSLLQTIVDENARLEDIEDRKVQIEYNNVFNKGVKSVEDKIKAKIEVMNTNIVNAEKFDCDYIGQCRFAKYVLQSLLEKE